ncbi:(2Fe-2S)-binding protein [Roseomonas chloroacetimidivorans]|uniref:(2Fe-2S)-binding protein n=1 Tax=Roseomonas chloroacetimidivorans TaxID=1766656 RepID=UPI003C72803E
MHDRTEVELVVNGRQYRRSVEPRYLLADFLRHELGLKGTHIGCEHGVCGACTVKIDGQTARSCLHFAVAVQGSQITTVEGIAGPDALHPIQEAFHEHHALQCGFCTPGMLMTVSELLERNPSPSEADIRVALTSNICRCTGYTNIVKAVAAVAAKLRQRPAEMTEAN